MIFLCFDMTTHLHWHNLAKIRNGRGAVEANSPKSYENDCENSKNEPYSTIKAKINERKLSSFSACFNYSIVPSNICWGRICGSFIRSWTKLLRMYPDFSLSFRIQLWNKDSIQVRIMNRYTTWFLRWRRHRVNILFTLSGTEFSPPSWMLLILFLFSGDSAGGNLLVAATLKCIQIGLPLPSGLFLAYTPFLLQFVPSPSRYYV